MQLRSAQADESDAVGATLSFRTPPVPVVPPAPTPTAGTQPAPTPTPSPGGGAPAVKRCVVLELEGPTYATAKKRLVRANCTLGRSSESRPHRVADVAQPVSRRATARSSNGSMRLRPRTPSKARSAETIAGIPAS